LRQPRRRKPVDAADPPAAGPSPPPEGDPRKVLRLLRRAYPEVACALEHRNPFELLAATILSAQCTDKMVNRVTPGLFARYPDAAALAAAEPAELEGLIHRTGFFRAKARSLRGMAAALVERHGGEVPRDLDALTVLPGVGRKTANVVLGVAFGLATGVVVDTHVKRLSRRLGLSRAADPVRIERDLMAAVPRREWIDFSHRLIAHGRAVCLARAPKCGSCPLLAACPRAGLPPL
jgi:endonuclease-3